MKEQKEIYDLGFKHGSENQHAEDLEKFWDMFQKYATYYHPRKQEEVCIMTKQQFLKALGEDD